MALFGEDRKEFFRLSPIEKRINFDHVRINFFLSQSRVSILEGASAPNHRVEAPSDLNSSESPDVSIYLPRRCRRVTIR
jgi:hypothetical protein